MEIKKILRPVLKISNIVVFVSYIVTAFVMYRYADDRDLGIIILFAVFLFLLYNKVEDLNRRMKIMEIR